VSGHEGAESAAWLNRLPVAVLVLVADGSATAVNSAWVTQSGMPQQDSLGYGWLNAVLPPEREAFVADLRRAAAQAMSGRADRRLALAAGERWTRWWWQPSPSEGLVCVAVIEDSEDRGTRGTPSLIDLSSALVFRISGVGLLLESAAGLVAGGPVAERLRRAIDELDGVIRDIRDAVYGAHTAPPVTGDS
jgi:PAS domain-containing protein